MAMPISVRSGPICWDSENGFSRTGMAKNTRSNQSGAFSLITSLFFMWGFLTSMNDILIPYLKGAFELTDFQSSLVQTAFFGAYFIGSLIYFLASMVLGDPILRIGYKNGILGGLLISALGAALFYPAAQAVSYPLFLTALFTLGLGFTLLQISANPYVTLLGPEKSASSRLNLAQGFNSLGTTIAPMLGGYLIFSYFKSQHLEGADAVKLPYIVFAAVLVLIAVLIAVAKLPKVTAEQNVQADLQVLKYPQVWLGMLAIFFYVGAEVSVGSYLIRFFGTAEMGNIGEGDASKYVAMYWGGLMIGRFLGAVSLSEIKEKSTKLGLMAGIAVVCVAVIFLGIILSSGEVNQWENWPFLIFVALNFGGFLLGKSLPGRTMGVFAVIISILLITMLLTSGSVAKWTVIGVGLFNSIMWSNVFSLTLDGLGKYKSQASSMLVMMIIGGALIPPLQGLVSDATGSIHFSYIVPVCAYAYLAFYGFFIHRFQINSSHSAEQNP